MTPAPHPGWRPAVEAALVGRIIRGEPIPAGLTDDFLTERRHRELLRVVRDLYDRGETATPETVYDAIGAVGTDWSADYALEVAHVPGAIGENPLARHLYVAALREARDRRWLDSVGATLRHVAANAEADPRDAAATARAALAEAA